MTLLVPEVNFHVRVRDESIEGPNPYRWENITTKDFFENKKVIVFSLPGAFTPTCSTYQLPGYEEKYEEFKYLGIDEVYCLSVNDSFVMNAWFKQQNVRSIKPIPDGSGEFTHAMGMSVSKSNLGFGFRSWRYSMLVNNLVIEKIFEEPGKIGNCSVDPCEVSDPQTMLNYLKLNA